MIKPLECIFLEHPESWNVISPARETFPMSLVWCCQMLIIAHVFPKRLPCQPHFCCFPQPEGAVFLPSQWLGWCSQAFCFTWSLGAKFISAVCSLTLVWIFCRSHSVHPPGGIPSLLGWRPAQALPADQGWCLWCMYHTLSVQLFVIVS